MTVAAAPALGPLHQVGMEVMGMGGTVNFQIVIA